MENLVWVSTEDLPAKASGAGRPSTIDPLVAAYRAGLAEGKTGNLEITGMVSKNSLPSFRKRHSDLLFFTRGMQVFIGVKPPKTRKRTAVAKTSGAVKKVAKASTATRSRSTRSTPVAA